MAERTREQKDRHNAWQRLDRLKKPEQYRAREKKKRLAHPEKVKMMMQAWRAKNPDKAHRLLLKGKYNITPEDYAYMLKKQGGVCAICLCHQRYQRLAVDHDHKTGQIRGLLCQHCNRALGHMFDSPLRLIRAAEYLRTTKQKGPLDADKDSQRNVVKEPDSDTHSGILRGAAADTASAAGACGDSLRTGAKAQV